MLDFLDHLRKKPIYFRKKLAFLISAGITLIILLFWLSLQTAIPNRPVDNSVLEEELKPLKAVKNISVNLFGAGKEIWASIFGESASSSLEK